MIRAVTSWPPDRHPHLTGDTAIKKRFLASIAEEDRQAAKEKQANDKVLAEALAANGVQEEFAEAYAQRLVALEEAGDREAQIGRAAEKFLEDDGVVWGRRHIGTYRKSVKSWKHTLFVN